MNDPRSVLADLRMGDTVAAADLEAFAIAMGQPDQVSDAQLGAFAMGLCRTPLTPEARVALTLGMRASGKVLNWDLPGPVLDKHSTGGVGDCVSLILAPALAASGAFVPMISGRGLGHTGGTLDKLESIPGLSAEQDLSALESITREAGCAIVGATADIAPADRRLYAVRDETETVQSLDLITASILSKKLAAGLGGLVLDVKVGSGAFMETPDQAQDLARSLVETATGAGCPTRAIITDMSQPLASAAGNALEVAESLRVLSGCAPEARLTRLTAELGGVLLHIGGLAETAREGAAKIMQALTSGQAIERFAAMVRAQGGPGDFTENWSDRLPATAHEQPLWPARGGVVTSIDTRRLGEAVVALGGGRRKVGDRIDPAVGLSDIAQIGDRVGQDRPLLMLHSARVGDAEAVEAGLSAAFQISDGPVSPPPLVHGHYEEAQ